MLENSNDQTDFRKHKQRNELIKNPMLIWPKKKNLN